VAVAASRRRLAAIDAQQAAARGAIEALGGRVIYEHRTLVNALQILAPASALEAIGRLPGVVRLDPVSVHRRQLTSAVPFIGGYQAWGGAAHVHGDGIRIGIIDTGIDYTHADFGGPGDPQVYKDNDPKIIEPGSFPTARVVGGRDFAGDAYDATNAATQAPHPDPDPLDCLGMQGMEIAGGHGTHVAGIAGGQGVLKGGQPFAGPYDQSVDPGQFLVGPGVAPGASLYALKIFGCTGSTALTGAALDWAADPDHDGDMSDRLDVLNLSLGGAYGLTSGTETDMITSLSTIGVFLAIAAGNEGNAFYSAGWPGTATEALGVAATTDTLTFSALTIDSPASIAGDVPCAEGAFTRPLADTGVLSGTLVATKPAGACTNLTNAAQLAGKVALIDRGSCSFVKKVAAAQTAGAIAVVVADNEAGSEPFAMGGDGSSAMIPGVMIRQADGDTIKSKLGAGVTVTLDPKKSFVSAIGADQVADFSSRGPRSPDNVLKPDLGAPGVFIDSAGVGTGTGPRQLQGTSMACPMVAGAAALVRQARPGFSPAEVKAALMNSAVGAKGPAGESVPVSLVGAGRVEVDQAVLVGVTAAAEAPAGAVSVSFGALVASQPLTRSQVIVLTNPGDDPVDFSASIAPTYPLAGVTLAVDPTTVTVPAKGQAKVTVTLALDPAAMLPETPDPSTPPTAFGQPRHFLTEAGGRVLFAAADHPHPTLGVPYHAVVRAASELVATPAQLCAAGTTGPVQINLTGPSAHPSPVTTVFELGAVSKEQKSTDPAVKKADLLAVGAANNLASAESFAKGSVYFGAVVAGDWATPAEGSHSQITVLIDTNLDSKADFYAVVEPFTGDQPFADVIAVSTYDASTMAPKSKRFVNIFPRDTVDTQVFNNSVLVLPVTIGDLGLTPGSAKIRYAVVATSVSPESAGEQTVFIPYDLDHPRIDTASHGKEGRPLFVGPGPILVDLAPDASPPPDVLLLHHTNVAGLRHEIVSLAKIVQGDPVDLVLGASGPAQAAAGKPAAVAVTIRNAGPGAATSAQLTGTLTGGQILAATPSQGSCTGTDSLSCQLGDLAPDATVTIALSVAPAAPGPLALALSASSAGCDPDPSTNQAAVSIAVAGGGAGGAGGQGGAGQGAGGATAGHAGATPAAPAEDPPLSIGGGCDCSLAGPRRPAGPALPALLALGLLALGRLARRPAGRPRQ
jgi:hypothetical protein